MSKTIKRNVLIVLFAVVAAFSLAFSFVFKSAKAEESSSTVSTAIGQADGVVMLEGASARMTSNGTYSDGLRAIVTVTSDVYNTLSATDSTTTLQVWFTTAQNFTTAQTASVKLLKANSQVCNFNVNDLYQVDGLYYGNAVLTNLSTKNQQDYQFVAIGVLVTMTDRTTTYKLGGFAERDVKNNTRSLYERVNAAFLNSDAECNAILSNNTYANWYGKATHPIVINSQADYNNLIARATTIDLSDLYAIKKASDTFTGDFTDQAKAPIVVETVKATVKANGTTTEINVPKNSDITSTLNGLVPADTEDKYFDSWSVEDEGDITNVMSDITVNAVMNDYLTITVVDKYNTENENATLSTIGKVKAGERLADYITKSTFTNATQPEGASHKGYIVTPNGSEASKVSSLDNLEVTANTTISLWMATLQNVQVNVKVLSYNLVDSAENRFAPITTSTDGLGWWMFSAGKTLTYEDKSSEFTDLQLVTGYEGEKIDLSAFLSKLPEQYILNTTAALNGEVTIDGSTYATNQEIVEGENSIDVYLDINEEALGFAMSDIIVYYNGTPTTQRIYSEKLSLTRIGDQVGVYVRQYDAANNYGIALCLKSTDTRDNLQQLSVKYGYMTAAAEDWYMNVIARQVKYDLGFRTAYGAAHRNNTSEFNVSDMDYNTLDLLASHNKNDKAGREKSIDNFDMIVWASQQGFADQVVFLQKIMRTSKVNVSTETNTTMDATELKKYVRPLSDAGTLSIVEDGEKTALRYTATKDEPTYGSAGWGIRFNFNDIDITKFENIKITFKMPSNYARNIRFDFNGGNVGMNFDPNLANGKICVLDALNLPEYNGTGSQSSVDYTNFISNGTPITSILLRTPANNKETDGKVVDEGFQIDVYSIEFVVKTTPQA